MAEETITDGTSNTIPIEEEVGQDAEAPAGDTTSGSGIPTGRGEPPPADTAPPDAPTGDTTSPNPTETDKSDPSAEVPPGDPVEGDPSAEVPPGDPVEGDPSAEVPLDDFTESGASPEADGEVNEPVGAPEPPPVPEVIDPDDGNVFVGPATEEDGSQTLLLDLDGDGLFETRAVGQELEDGSFKVVSSETLDEPLDPEDFGGSREPDAGNAGAGTPEITPDNADEAGTDEPINEFEDQKPEVPRDPEGEEPTGNEVVGGENNPPTGEELVEDVAIPPGQELEDADGRRPDREVRPDPEGDEPPGVVVVDNPDEPPTGDEPPAAPKDDDVDDAPPGGGLDENKEIQPDDEPDPADQLRPDRESPPPEDEADPIGEAVPDVPPLPNEPPVAEQPPAEQPPAYEPPAGGHDAPPAGEGEVELPGLYDAPPPYASGSDGHAPPAGGVASDDPGHEPAGEPVPGVPVPADDCEPDATDDEPIEVKTEEDGDDAGLLEQVADAVGDLWDDAKDAVT